MEAMTIGNFSEMSGIWFNKDKKFVTVYLDNTNKAIVIAYDDGTHKIGHNLALSFNKDKKVTLQIVHGQEVDMIDINPEKLIVLLEVIYKVFPMKE